jgi:hypothetical protein
VSEDTRVGKNVRRVKSWIGNDSTAAQELIPPAGL